MPLFYHSFINIECSSKKRHFEHSILMKRDGNSGVCFQSHCSGKMLNQNAAISLDSSSLLCLKSELTCSHADGLKLFAILNAFRKEAAQG